MCSRQGKTLADVWRCSADYSSYRQFEHNSVNAYPPVLTFVLGAQKSLLIDMVLLNTHNILFE